jgi:DNA-binding GntR family transcriptional regulator
MKRGSPSSAEEAYQALKAMLMRYELVPGQRLKHRELAARIGVSVVPLREAFARLVQEGYLRHVPRGGYSVQEIGLDEAEELFDVREALEVFALARAIEHGDPGAFRRVERANARYAREVRRPLRKERLVQDMEFHLAIARLAGNRLLAEVLEGVFTRIVLKRKLEGLVTAQRAGESLAEHREIVRALRAGNAALAVKAMRRHIRGAREFVVGHLRALEALRHG